MNLTRLWRRTGSFEGGLHLPPRREWTQGRPIAMMPPPPLLHAPMRLADGPLATITVTPGQQVAAGDVIGRAECPGGLDIHAPLAGQVLRIGRIDTATLTDVPAVVIRPSASAPAAIEPYPRPHAGWRPDPCSVETLAMAAEHGGLINSGPRPRGFAQELRDAAERGVCDVIMNGLDGEPMLTVNEALLDEYLDTVILAGQWLRTALGEVRIWLAVDRGHRRLLARCRRASAGTPVRIAGLTDKYPQHHPILLTAAITRREVPPGGQPQDAGAWVVELPAILALAAAVPNPGGDYPVTPMTYRVVTVTGPAVQRPGHYWTAEGTSYEHILRHVGLREPASRVIDGGPMTGRAIAGLDAVVTRCTSAIVVLDRRTDRVPSPGPCVRCGWCQEDCPVGIDPQALLDLYERERYAQAEGLHARACLGCGICSFVCPTELPLTEATVGLKARLETGKRGGTGMEDNHG